MHTYNDTEKTIQVKAERNLLGHLLLISQENAICLEKLFQYPLGPIPWSLATADRGLVKTDKSQLMHFLENVKMSDNMDKSTETSIILNASLKTSDSPDVDNCTVIIDGNALYQAIVQLPNYFEELAYNIFCSLPKATGKKSSWYIISTSY